MKTLTFEKHGDIGIIFFNRPEAHNALNRSTLQELLNLLSDLAKDQIKGIILTGMGNKSFISGADIKEMALMSKSEMQTFITLGKKVAATIEESPFLTLAAINGYCLGGGLEMALACDFILASPSASFGLPEVSLGLIPAFGGTQRLTHLIGYSKAKEMIISGKIINASLANEYGIVNKIIESENLIKDALFFLESLLKHPLKALLQAKKAVKIATETRLATGLQAESEIALGCFDSAECLALMKKFAEKGKK